MREKRIDCIETLELLVGQKTHSFTSLRNLVQSRFHNDTSFEGIVVKDYTTQTFQKIVIEQLDEIMAGFITPSILSDIRSNNRIKRKPDLLLPEILQQIHAATGRWLHDDIAREYLKW